MKELIRIKERISTRDKLLQQKTNNRKNKNDQRMHSRSKKKKRKKVEETRCVK